MAAAGERRKPQATSQATGATVTTSVPARLDRLPWSRWHWTVVIGLGTVWILDGLEVTVVGNIASRLAQPGSGLHITSAQVTGVAAALYVAGACVGALFFGRLTDRYGRKRLFLVTLGLYLAATALTGLSFQPWWFFLFRFLTGFGIGGEYAAINSAIDELIPSAHRGRVDLIINGSFWLGAVGGSLLSILMLDTAILPAALGWRLTFALGVLLGLVILLVRRHVPESPRWLFIHGRGEEAEALVADVERRVTEETGRELPAPAGEITIHQRRDIGFAVIARTVFRHYPRRTALGLALFVGQAFLYNAITFGFGAILTRFFAVPADRTGYYFAVIAIGNFLGPLALGKLFDTVGRRPMISGTYLGSAVLLFGTAALFGAGRLTAVTLTACWCAVLFLASAGASSAYLTVSEVFPMETRAMAIAFFYAVGTAAGGISGPLLFADLTGSGVVGDTVLAFCVGAGLMAAAGVVAAFLAVPAERRSLEEIATPLSAAPATPRPATPSAPA
ncbi:MULTISPECIES: MFS transporter [Streptomycetaceae]|uniref:Sugar transport protein n=1 Tax=Streptantibioticus cattleyicolor (strain ATCC 35852 / DSM 46488 / JCM 4925 / NBRC 14057 / NRRL 8057) TaxID=1003195 RepID=F8K1F2_STREN|nr:MULTISPECIES: MFS transporter [Streptomycetaceae]AEW97448.1 sugar transport protein [Streptantibioticus cattleyicolor NRRL 8057 = DSM 46488]MYS61884.1 MFS transporter [Streptomyces sp. SID5468]CCB77767.1 putative sugar transport protein [Streptantibioticus cattleyicolor NRRL 8057 = DSM 46488]